MTTEKENNIKKIVSILIQLDEKSLLLIDSGAKLLATRQQMDIKDMETENKEGWKFDK